MKFSSTIIISLITAANAAPNINETVISQWNSKDWSNSTVRPDGDEMVGIFPDVHNDDIGDEYRKANNGEPIYPNHDSAPPPTNNFATYQSSSSSGDVFGYVAINSKSPQHHLKVVMTRKDGSLALESDGSRQLEAVIFDEFGLMFQAFPVKVMNLDTTTGQLKLVNTLYRPTVHWKINDRRVLTRDNKPNAWICLSNGVNQIYWFDDPSKACSGGTAVLLMAADLKTITNLVMSNTTLV